MKKFKYTLQSVLDLKKQLLEGLKIEISNINNEYNILDREINKLHSEYHIIKNESDEEMKRNLTISEITYSKIKIKSLLSQIEKKEIIKDKLMRKKEEKEKEMITRNTEISGLEKLRDKELDKYNQKAAKAEELFIEEFVSHRKVSGEFAI